MHCITIKDIIGCSVECHSSLIPCVCVSVCCFFHCGCLSLQHGLQRLCVNICLCAVCIRIWPPVSAIWIMLCCLWCEICYGNGSCDRDIHSVCVCLFGLHVSAGLRNSQFIGLWVRPIFLSLSTHNSAFLFYSVQALRVMIHMYSISQQNVFVWESNF